MNKTKILLVNVTDAVGEYGMHYFELHGKSSEEWADFLQDENLKCYSVREEGYEFDVTLFEFEKIDSDFFRVH